MALQSQTDASIQLTDLTKVPQSIELLCTQVSKALLLKPLLEVGRVEPQCCLDIPEKRELGMAQRIVRLLQSTRGYDLLSPRKQLLVTVCCA